MLSGRTKRILFFILVLMPIMILIAASYPQTQTHAVAQPAGDDTQSASFSSAFPAGRKLSTWVAYWDYGDAGKELTRLADELESVSLFEVYYDEDMQLMLPEGFGDMEQAVSEAGLDGVLRYITFVNDWQQADGQFSLKDADLLHALLDNDETAAAHAQAMVDFAAMHGYDGVELDFEAIRLDMALWQRYTRYISDVYNRCSLAGLDMRVVLEPGTPFEDVEFPAGPQYVVMCYNYYGGHSGPGPKAAPDFIRDIATRSSSLPGDVSYALATGGFNWGEDGKATALTEKQALELSKLHGAYTQRDENSRAVTFTFTDAESSTCTVWYADDETLRHWADCIYDATGKSPTIALWRVGGNVSIRGMMK